MPLLRAAPIRQLARPVFFAQCSLLSHPTRVRPSCIANMSTNSKDQKNPKFGHLQLSTSGPLETALTGNALLRSPYFNKGSAFTKEERETFKLHGHLPQNVQTLEEQVKRAYAQYSSRPNDLAKNTFMTSLKEQNEILYYKVQSRSRHFGKVGPC